MSTGYAPPAIPSPETGTPPKEWSESVFASNPTNDTPAAFSETEGGAEGQSREYETQKEQEKQYTQQSGTTRDQPTVAQTAKQFMPEQVGKAVDYAAQTVAPYLPNLQGIKDTVTSYLSPEESHQETPHVSLPSTELRGAQPSECPGGVGALPGNLSESSVALLPDERQERARESAFPRQRRDTIKPSPLAGVEEPRVSEKAETIMPRDAALSGDGPAISQPSDALPKSTETGAAESSSPGVESQKAVSEAKGQQSQNEQGKTGSHAGSEKDVEGSDLGSEAPIQGKDPLQDAQEEGIKEGKHVPATFKPGYSGDYHPAQLHPPPPGASVAEFQSSLGSQQEEPEAPITKSSKRGSAGAEKKPGLMTMVKGEMKILAGKVSGDEHKVEEGKRIVHGEA